MLRLASLLLGLVIAVAGPTPPASSQTPDEVTVFAAASLTNALQEVADAFTRRDGTKVKLSFAASSSLAKQIEAGAAAQLFLSADEAWMNYLEVRGLLAPGSRRALLGNQLVLVVAKSNPLALDLGSGRAWLERLPSGRIATGDPAHVPVGKYAQQALTRLGLWSDVEPRLARADNVRNALVLVERGEAAAGIVYSTDAAISKQVIVAGTFPATSHDAIVYPVAMLRGNAQGAALKLYEFLASPQAREIFTRHGFASR